MKKIPAFLLAFLLPSFVFANTIVVDPTSGLGIGDLSITALSPACSGPCIFIVYDDSGNALGGDYLGTATPPVAFSSLNNPLNGGAWASISSLTSLPPATYTILYFQNSGTNTGACSEHNYPDMSGNTLALCTGSWDGNGAYTTFEITGYVPPEPEATSTVDQVQSNLSTGFVLFLATFCITIWMYKPRNG